LDIVLSLLLLRFFAIVADRPATVDCRKMIGSGSAMALRILIIDDSSEVRYVMRKVFESEPGWLVCGEASNGKEGIEMAERVHPNLIILDLSMPVMNGLEAAKILNHSMPTVPLIMFTSFQTESLQEQALAAGINKLVLKSGPLGELMNCVRVFAKDAA
jgi:DNA-binding NarL/FixJ family response regulator